MKRLVKLTLGLGALAMTTSCSTIPNSITKTQHSQMLTQVSYTQTVATAATISIDGSSTVYPITQAIAKEYQSNTKNSVQVTVGISGTSGRRRTGTMLASYLISVGLSYEDAIETIQMANPLVELREAQSTFLRELAEG